MKSASGSYVGNGISGRAITVGFQPDLIIYETSSGVAAGFIWLTGLGSKPLTSDAVFATDILSVTSTGFTISDSNTINTDGTTYQWWAAGADADDLAIFSYTGDATDNKNVGSFTFTPNMAWVLPANTAAPQWRTDQLAGDLAQAMGFGAASANGIQQLNAGSIQVGSELTGTSVEHHVVVFKAVAGVLAITEYTGNATDNRDVAHGLGASPSFVLIQAQNDAEPTVMRFKDMAGDAAIAAFTGGTITDRIQAVDATNVQLGANDDVNQNTIVYTLVTFGEDLGVVNPTIVSIVPDEGPAAGGTAVTITGTDFATGATVTFGGNAATSVNVVNDTTITCVTPAGTAGAVDVVVTNTDTGTVTEEDGFTYISQGGGIHPQRLYSKLLVRLAV